MRLFRAIAARWQWRDDVRASRTIATDDIASVCLFLGPDRHFAAFTASILSRHPHCLVFESGGDRVFNTRDVDFLSHYSDATFMSYVRYAIYISQNGSSAQRRGSAVSSDALGMRKAHTTSLVWNEPLGISRHVQKHYVNLDYLFARNKHVRFLIPVRNPLDCALEKLGTGLVGRSQLPSRGASLEKTIEAIVDEFAWIHRVSELHPHRYLPFFENEFSENALIELAIFLGLSPLPEWRSQAIGDFTGRRHSVHAPAITSFYQNCITKKFPHSSRFKDALLRFAQAHAVA